MYTKLFTANKNVQYSDSMWGFLSIIRDRSIDNVKGCFHSLYSKAIGGIAVWIDCIRRLVGKERILA